MKTDFELNVQAYLDGELPENEVKEVQAVLAARLGSQELLRELTQTRDLLRQNEPQAPLTDSRDFYWSQIRRRIDAEEKAKTAASQPGWSFRRFFAPLITGAACVFALVVGIGKFNSPANSWSPVVIENMSSETTSMSFRSPSENLFVVWVYDRNEELASAQSAEESLHD